ncbi:endothelin-converting enzyme homolog isoform X1 [Acropora palmata]|uniref:endothelin-converting enzyme homolog isoform X1 n=1 Tax=Acropora palmata TaxID=6131 RepID=UPI003DA1A568
MESRSQIRGYATTGQTILHVLAVLVIVFLALVSCASLPPEKERVLVRRETTIEANSSKETALDDSKQNKSAKSPICQSESCKQIAKLIQEVRDEKVDPCDNFYEYACGNWIKHNPVPPGHLQFSRITQLSKNNERIMKEALIKDKSEDTETIMKVKNFYRSCLNVKKIDDLGREPLMDYIKTLGSWSLDEKWSPRHWNFYDVLANVQKDYPVDVFFSVNVIQDPVKPKGSNKKKYIILVDQAKLNLPQIIYFTSPKILREVWLYMSVITNLSGVSFSDSKTAMRELLVFEGHLALYWVPKVSKKYVRIPIGKLADALPEFPWLNHLRKVLSRPNLSNDDMVIVLANDYLQNMIDLLRKKDKRILSTYVIWRSIKDSVPLLSKRFRDVHQMFKRRLLGSKSKKTREEVCFSYTNNILGPMLGAVFIRNAFKPESKEKVEVMMEGIIKAFKDRVSGVGWIDNQTVQAVREKADAAVYKVGYPEYLWKETEFSQRYKLLNVTSNQWFKNVLNTDKFSNYQTYSKLGRPVDRHQWITVPQLVNAFYVITKNEIVVPSGILQPPFFYGDDIPRSLSYGAIGHVLGHELTHGFDTTGRKFDKNGELIEKRTCWSEPAIKTFQERAKCLVEQFSKYKVLNKFHISGLKTLGENIADLGGVNLAYHAYNEFNEKNGPEQILPELNMTSKELFFIGYAQKECTRTTPSAEFLSVTEDVHALTKYRVIGTLSNLQEFSDVFNCTVGSYMNPKKKCEVW